VKASLGIAALATLGLGAALASGGPAALAIQAWLLALGALGLGTAALAARAAAPRAEGSELERALHRRPPVPSRPLQLERVEREVVLGAGSAFDLHYRLRTTLREIAAQRLSERRGLELDAAGPEALSAETWALLRPDREPPRDRHAVGMKLADLERVIAELESL
jgi:hypothetical protein